MRSHQFLPYRSASALGFVQVCLSNGQIAALHSDTRRSHGRGRKTIPVMICFIPRLRNFNVNLYSNHEEYLLQAPKNNYKKHFFLASAMALHVMWRFKLPSRCWQIPRAFGTGVGLSSWKINGLELHGFILSWYCWWFKNGARLLNHQYVGQNIFPL